ncbi:MAG: carboxylating nicotinate-nucleotide diphosphorylase [Elusimicrobiota bacterium]
MRIDPLTDKLIVLSLREDLGRRGDVTTRCFLPKNTRFKARILCKSDGVLCGVPVVNAVFRRVCPRAVIAWRVKDGERVRKGAVVARVTGPREILTAERTALNFLQQLSGIATLTRAFVERAGGSRTRIYDTRKTLPGWRTLAKYAVRAGGGANHRMGLYDMAMLKDNHMDGLSAEDLKRRIRAFRRRYPRVPVEIEARDRGEIDKALAVRADVVLLDNMRPAALAREIRHIRRAAPRTQIEISGGVDLRAVQRLARLGADRISVGRLTHSAPALDISMKLEGS